MKIIASGRSDEFLKISWAELFKEKLPSYIDMVTPWVHKNVKNLKKYFLDFLARAYSKNVEGQDLLLKEYPTDFSSQHYAAQSPQSQDLSAHGSPSLNQSQEIKVSAIMATFNCL